MQEPDLVLRQGPLVKTSDAQIGHLENSSDSVTESRVAEDAPARAELALESVPLWAGELEIVTEPLEDRQDLVMIKQCSDAEEQGIRSGSAGQLKLLPSQPFAREVDLVDLAVKPDL